MRRGKLWCYQELEVVSYQKLNNCTSPAFSGSIGFLTHELGTFHYVLDLHNALLPLNTSPEAKTSHLKLYITVLQGCVQDSILFHGLLAVNLV